MSAPASAPALASLCASAGALEGPHALNVNNIETVEILSTSAFISRARDTLATSLSTTRTVRTPNARASRYNRAVSHEHSHEHRSPDRRGVLYAIAAAALFGASTPLSRALLASVAPTMLAALLYLGGGAGLALSWAIRRGTPLERRDAPWLAAVSLVGGVLAPIALLVGLKHSAASVASLLLNLESVFTALIAWRVFREPIDRRLAFGMALVLAGSLVLTASGAGALSTVRDGRAWGPWLIVLACFLWAVDNNGTRKISDADVRAVVSIKCLVAGSVNLAIALATGARWPSGAVIAKAMALGSLSYGASLLLFVLALRHLGAARTGSWFALAPFVGALGSTVFLQEPVTVALIVATAAMGLGLALHAIERHEHEHAHAELEHEHPHRHDDGHHGHAHADGEALEGHSHRHRHERVVHRHPHFPDTHHQHTHDA